jgi:O-antigen/teichoic acid export membrane protein
MKPGQKVVKNLVWNVFSGVVGGGLQFACVIVVARNLGVQEFGTYNYLLTFLILFQMLTDFGMVNILVREIARRPDDLRQILRAAKGLMWLLFLAAIPILGVAVLVTNAPGEVKAQSFVMGVAALTFLEGVSYAAVLRAFEDMEFSAIGFTLHKLVLLGFTIGILNQGYGLWGLVFAHLTANLLLWLYYALVVGFRFRLWVSFRMDLGLWKTMIGEAIPLGGGLLLRQLGWQVDSLLLYWLSDSYSAGLFGGPYRLLLAARVVSMLLVLPLYPGFVRFAKDSLPEFWVAYGRSLKAMVCLSFPGAILFVFAPEIVVRTVLGPKFLASMGALQWFGLAFVPMFITALFPYVFTALGRQRIFFIVTGVALVSRVLAEIWFIPRFGYISASVIGASCEFLAFVAFVAILARSRIRAVLADAFLKPALAGSVMAAVLYLGQLWFGSQGPLVLKLALVFVALVAYLGVLAGIKPFSKTELSAAADALNFVGPYLRSFRQKPGTTS